MPERIDLDDEPTLEPTGPLQPIEPPTIAPEISDAAAAEPEDDPFMADPDPASTPEEEPTRAYSQPLPGVEALLPLTQPPLSGQDDAGDAAASLGVPVH